MTISAVLVVQDAERHIADCIDCLGFANEVLVIDGGSRDRTADRAGTLGARVISRPFDTFARQRQFALGQADSDWVLFVDHDERVSTGLADEILSAVSRDEATAPVGYWIPRRNYIAGRWIRGGGWNPDRQLRLLRRDRALYEPDRPVHEVARLDGRAGVLACSIVHYNYDGYGQFLRKQWHYARLEAERRGTTGGGWRWRRLLTAPIREWWRRLIVEGGLRDGAPGVALAGGMSWYAFLVEMRVRAYAVRVSSTSKS